MPLGDVKPDGIATAEPAAISAVGSVITVNGKVAVPTHGDAEGTTGVGTRICGLWPSPPASVAVGGIVESVYVGSAMVERPGIVTTTLLPKSSMMALVLAVGSQVPLMVDPPKGGAAGSVVPGRIGGGRVPSNGSEVVALKSVFGVPVAPGVVHDVIDPILPPVIPPIAPVLIVPSAIPGRVLTVDRTCWAKVELPPNTTITAVMKTKLRIGTSCV